MGYISPPPRSDGTPQQIAQVVVTWKQLVTVTISFAGILTVLALSFQSNLESAWQRSHDELKSEIRRIADALQNHDRDIARMQAQHDALARRVERLETEHANGIRP